MIDKYNIHSTQRNQIVRYTQKDNRPIIHLLWFISIAGIWNGKEIGKYR